MNAIRKVVCTTCGRVTLNQLLDVNLKGWRQFVPICLWGTPTKVFGHVLLRCERRKATIHSPVTVSEIISGSFDISYAMVCEATTELQYWLVKEIQSPDQKRVCTSEAASETLYHLHDL